MTSNKMERQRGGTLVKLHSKFINQKELLKKFAETTQVKKWYPDLIQFICGSARFRSFQRVFST